jgi:predicted pyridoxine 5'-phosphate oxidase superfamily flavin-nucleotide-binding protein
MHHFHEGELSVQERAGLRDEASRLGGMLAAPNLDGGVAHFLAERDLAMITARDDRGDLWTSPLYGRPGFLTARSSTLSVSATPMAGDPLAPLHPDQQVGVLVIDFGKRRRLRVNGTVARVGAHELEIDADQAYGNCPQYIQQRHLRPERLDDDHLGTSTARYDTLQPEDIAQIMRADTMILGTIHPTRGADTSHRGGAPGFVRVEDGTLWWPDYPGNNMFNSLGNIIIEPAAALLFLDFTARRALQVSGTAVVEWVSPGSPGDDGGTGRRVRLTPTRVAATTGIPLRSLDLAAYPRNPQLT